MSNINVAIADDNERIRQNLQEIISKEKDMTLVGSASDGLDTLSMIRTSHPDVVLLDIIMPKMDGLKVLEEINKDESCLKKPAFIILTALGQEEVMEERRLKVLEAYNNVTAQLATIKAKAENAALYNAQMKISENNFIQGKIDIISLSLERARRSGAVTSYAEARVSLHNAIILLEMLTNVKIIKGK